MVTTHKVNYFKIGLFVIGAAAIVILTVVVLGTGAIFKKMIRMETYFDESVQGLNVGSPVKRRGVQIGNVESIDFVSSYYLDDPSDKRYYEFGKYVVIRVALDPEVFGGVELRAGNAVIRKMVQDGLRFRLAPQGLTGLVFLELDYVDPAKNPPLQISWKPKTYYVPSVPSFSLSKIGSTADDLITRVQKIDVEGILNELKTFLQTLNRTVDESDVASLTDSTTALIEDLQATNQKVYDLMNRPEVDKMAKDSAAAVENVRKITDSASKDFPEMSRSMNESMKRINEMTEEISSILKEGQFDKTVGNFAEISENLRLSTANLADTRNQVNKTIGRMDQIVATQQASLERIIENMKLISDNLRDMTTNARRYPSQVLFGEPPPRSEPAKR